jgi:hypothetical protein
LINIYQEAGYLYIGRSSHLQEQFISIFDRKDSAMVAETLLDTPANVESDPGI